MSDPLIQIEAAGPTGMVTLRADLSDKAARRAIIAAGLTVPDQMTVASAAGLDVLWMSPDELLILTAYGEADAMVASLSEAFGTLHHMAVNVSDARVMFALSGENARLREVLAKLSPADLRASQMPVGRMRRTRLAQVAAAFWFSSDKEANIIAFRSVQDYVYDLLTKVSEPGSAVDHF